MGRIVFSLFVLVVLMSSCHSDPYMPKPKGYFKIDFPEKSYRSYKGNCPFVFDYPAYTTITPDTESNAQPCWSNLNFSRFNGKIHLTYHQISSRTEGLKLMEYARELAFKHTVKANAIDQKVINYPERKVYGICYYIEGNTASSVQFFLTDSTKNYFRGALYFYERPQYDSIAPVVNFIKKDIDVMINTFRWKQ